MLRARCIEATLVRDKAQCPMCRAAVAPADLLEAPPEDEAAAHDQGQDAAPAVAPSAKVSGNALSFPAHECRWPRSRSQAAR